MKKYILVMFFIPVFAQASPIITPGTFQINETQTNSTIINYTIAGGSAADPITAFAVGFNEAAGFNGPSEFASFASDNESLFALPGQPEPIKIIGVRYKLNVILIPL